MFQVRTYLSSSFLRSSTIRSVSTTTTTLQTSNIAVADEQKRYETIYPDDWHTAKKYSEIPGPSRYEMIRGFLPGGVFRGMSMPQMQKHLIDNYGTMLRMPGMFGKPDIIMTANPDHFERIYRTEGVWPQRRSLAAYVHYRERLRPDVFKGMGGLVTDQGQTWHDLRSVVNPVLLSPKLARNYVPAIDAVTRDFVKKVHLLRDEHDELPATFGTELNLWAMESIGSIALDRRLGVIAFERDADAELMIKTVKDMFVLMYAVEVKPEIWKYFPTKEFKQLMEVFDNLTRLVLKHVNESIDQLKDENAVESQLSVLQKLLRINRDYAVLMTIDMFFAGIDTTSSTAASLLYLLANNPVEQERLRSEVFSVLPDSKAPLGERDLDQMPYMRACIKETLRVHPILPGHLRATGQNLVLSGYQIPLDTNVAMVTTGLMADNKYFEGAAKFNPDRWLRESKTSSTSEGCPATATKPVKPFTFLPFGFGPRMCVGRRFAEMEIQVLITRILRDYRIEWHHGTMQYGSALISSPISDLKYKFIPL